MVEELLFMHKQRKWCLEMETTSVKDAVHTVEMTTKDSEYDINSVDNRWESWREIDSSFKSCSVGQTLSTSHGREKFFMKESIGTPTFFVKI
jgi:hypothetical protein